MADFLDFTTLTRPRSPNSFLMAPDGVCRNAVPDAPSPRFDIAPDELYAQCMEQIGNEPALAVSRADAQLGRIEAVATTALLRFKDDLHIVVLPDADSAAGPVDGVAATARLAVYSQSRVGYSDMGTNAKRVRNLVKKLRAR